MERVISVVATSLGDISSQVSSFLKNLFLFVLSHILQSGLNYAADDDLDFLILLLGLQRVWLYVVPRDGTRDLLLDKLPIH